MTRRFASLAAALAGGLAAFAVPSCAVGPEDGADPVDGDDVPFGLLEPGPSSTTPSSAATGGAAIFLVSTDDELIAIPSRASGTTVDDVIEALRAPPTEGEQALGLRSALGSADAPLIRAASLEGGIVTVDLAEEFATLDVADQRLAIAQAVTSLTGLPGVGQVTFTIGRQPIEVPLADGALSPGPVARDDYAELVVTPAG